MTGWLPAEGEECAPTSVRTWRPLYWAIHCAWRTPAPLANPRASDIVRASCALWHFAMVDGDDEELEEEELQVAIEAFASGRTEPAVAGEAPAAEGAEPPEAADAAGPRAAKGGPRLWSTGDARERFLKALRQPRSCASVSMAAQALRAHHAAFGVLASSAVRAGKNKPERQLELDSYYHVDAFEEVPRGRKRARPSAKW